MFDSNIKDEDIEVIDFGEFDNFSELSNKVSSGENKSVNVNVDELVDMKNRILIQGQYPNKQVSFDSNNNLYVLSEDGFEDMYVNVVQNNGIYQIISVDINNQSDELDNSKSISNQKTLGTHPGVGSHFNWSDNGFMNVLFFIFLAGLSTGIIFMIAFNLFIK